MSTPQRFALLSANRFLLWAAVAVAALLSALASQRWMRLAGGLSAVGFVVAAGWLRKRRPQLILDEDGYQVQVAGRDRFRVAWRDVKRVLHDPSEQALYLDCGNPTHNLLLPPIAGFAFTFERRAELYARLLSRVGDRAEIVARLDQPPDPGSPSPPAPPDHTG